MGGLFAWGAKSRNRENTAPAIEREEPFDDTALPLACADAPPFVAYGTSIIFLQKT